MPYSLRSVGFFNDPQLFAARIVRQDLQLIVLIREDLKVADVVTKAAHSTQLF